MKEIVIFQNIKEIAARWGAGFGFKQPLERKNKVVCGNRRCAVAPKKPFLKIEGVNKPIGGNLIAFCRTGRKRSVLIPVQKSLKAVFCYDQFRIAGGKLGVKCINAD